MNALPARLRTTCAAAILVLATAGCERALTTHPALGPGPAQAPAATATVQPSLSEAEALQRVLNVLVREHSAPKHRANVGSPGQKTSTEAKEALRSDVSPAWLKQVEPQFRALVVRARAADSEVRARAADAPR